MSDREKFEAWYLSEYEISASDDSESSYDWTAWQAATQSALAQPSGEAQPVAHINTYALDGLRDGEFSAVSATLFWRPCDDTVPVYTHQQPASLPLTESEIRSIFAKNDLSFDEYNGWMCDHFIGVVRAIEAAILAQSGK